MADTAQITVLLLDIDKVMTNSSYSYHYTASSDFTFDKYSDMYSYQSVSGSPSHDRTSCSIASEKK